MAVNIEARLLGRTILVRDIKPLLDAKIDESWFHDTDARAVFLLVRDHYAKYAEVPTIQAVKANYPNYKIPKVEDSLEYLVDQMRDRRAYGMTVEILQEAGELVEEERDWSQALNVLTAGVGKIQLESSRMQDTNLPETAMARMEVYKERAANPRHLLGIPTGFPTIDKATLGLCEAQLVTIIATPKAGKSTLALRMALNAWQWREEYTPVPMFASFEMSNGEQEARHDCMLAGVGFQKFRSGNLTPAELKRLGAALEASSKEQDFILTSDISSATTVSGIHAKIEQYKPDVFFIDGVYLMTDENGERPGSPQALTNITRGLKRVAQRTNIPIVISTQVLPSKMSKKDGVTADAIGYSSSFFQDSDVILGLDRVAEDDESRMLKVVESRNCGRVDTELVWDWTHSRFEELSDPEYAHTKFASRDEGDEDERYAS